MDNYVPSLVSLQTEAYRAVLRAIAATELDWVRTPGLLPGKTSDAALHYLVVKLFVGHESSGTKFSVSARL